MNRSSRGESAPYETGREFSSSIRFAKTGPTPVYVRGVEDEPLGVGKLIGVLHLKDGSKSKVISIDEPESLTGQVELLATECNYTSLAKVSMEEVERSIAHIMSPAEYIAKCLHSALQQPATAEI